MFVRWKRRERVSIAGGKRRRTGKFLLSAGLVTSERRDGKPRQRVVAYLGSVDEERVKELYGRRHFWDAATRRLDALSLDRTQRRLVEAALHSVVVRLTARERNTTDQELAKLWPSRYGSAHE